MVMFLVVGSMYDTTLEGEVVKVKENNEYIIKYNGGEFVAESNVKYLVGDRVYVLVPGGDFSKRKIILNKLGSNRMQDEFYATSDNTFLGSLENAKLVAENQELIIAEAELDESSQVATRNFLSGSFENLNQSYGTLRLSAQLIASNIKENFKYGLKFKMADGKTEELIFTKSSLNGVQSSAHVAESQLIDSIVLFSERPLQENETITVKSIDISFVDEEAVSIFDVKLFGPDGLFIPEGGSLRLRAHTDFTGSIAWYYHNQEEWELIAENQLEISNLTNQGDYKVVITSNNIMIEDQITLIKQVQGLVNDGVNVYSQQAGNWKVENQDGTIVEIEEASSVAVGNNKKFYFQNIEYEIEENPYSVDFIGQDTFVYKNNIFTNPENGIELTVVPNFIYRKIIWELPNKNKSFIDFDSFGDSGNVIKFKLKENYSPYYTNNIIKIKVVDFENKIYEFEKQFIFIPMG